jgi:hypothetical protein
LAGGFKKRQGKAADKDLPDTCVFILCKYLIFDGFIQFSFFESPDFGFAATFFLKISKFSRPSPSKIPMVCPEYVR